MIQKAVHDFLLANIHIQDRVSYRIFPGRVPQHESLPAIVLTTINIDHDYHLQNEIEIVESIMQIDIYDKGQPSVTSTEEIAELVRLRLSGYRGDLSEEVFCHEATIMRHAEFDEPPVDKSDDWKRRISMDFRLFVNAPAPTHATE